MWLLRIQNDIKEEVVKVMGCRIQGLVPSTQAILSRSRLCRTYKGVHFQQRDAALVYSQQQILRHGGCVGLLHTPQNIEWGLKKLEHLHGTYATALGALQ